ncbi:MAG: helix-turn-helix transcriptional regulator [Clostridiales bacterium]|nr:helix-turn-helix transcriptional regulator [Clostridiales bacterium]
MDSFGIKLKRLRSEKELTQKELSSLLGLTRATISSYERCALYPSVEALISICQFFNVSADYMLGLSDTNTFDTSYLTDQQELIIRALLDEFREKNNRG